MHDDDNDHPLLLELSSLRQTAARFQHEAHAAAIKLQRHSLESSRLHEHAAALEQENARLMHEIDVVRALPVIQHHPAVAQVQELSLALRRVSDKVALTEDTLLLRTSELTHARNELAKARHTVDGAYALAARMRSREEASKARERELEFMARASEEERKMVDLVVQEYADLVRNLEGRKSANHTPPIQSGSTSTITLIDNLQDGKSSLHKVLTAFSTESEELHATIAKLNAKVSDLQMTLDAERMAASHDRTLLSQTKTELDKLNLEDQTAAKMVARYMMFSQASSNALQQQITTLKTRHASMINTLELQLSIAETQLSSERTRAARLQDALDELCEDLARESYGRRREVALRLSLLSREEGIAELLRRWARRAKESYARCYNLAQPAAPDVSSGDAVREAFDRVVCDAESLLSTLDDDMQFSDATLMSSSLARLIQSTDTVEALKSELQIELQKRIEAVRKYALYLPDGHLDGNASESPRVGGTPVQGADGFPDPIPILLTPKDNIRPMHEVASEASQLQDTPSPVSVVGISEESIDDSFVGTVPVAAPIVEPTEQTGVCGEIHPLPSQSAQDSASTLATLLVEEAPKALPLKSPAVSVLDLQQDLQPLTEECKPLPPDSPVLVTLDPPHDLQPRIDEPSTVDAIPIHILSDDTLPLPEDNSRLSPTSLTNSTPATPHDAPYTSSDSDCTLLSELVFTKHRYDAIQHAFRGCSLALKELKHSLVSFSPSLHTQVQLREHLETALARIDDYAEDARVELEIRIADEELTSRGYETILSVPGALIDPHERAKLEASARSFADGTDEGVARALDKFGKKLEDVQHDVAVVKRAVHELAMSDGEDGKGGADADSDAGSGAGLGWTTWTTGFLGANTTPSRSPMPAQTFGAVMTSPRLRHAPSLKELHAQAPHESSGGGPLTTLNLRIPMPAVPSSPSALRYTHLGMGHASEESTRPRTISAMYSIGGLRSSLVGFGVGLGGSSSPARTRVQGVSGRLDGDLGWGRVPSPYAGRNGHVDDTRVEEHDVE